MKRKILAFISALQQVLFVLFAVFIFIYAILMIFWHITDFIGAGWAVGLTVGEVVAEIVSARANFSKQADIARKYRNICDGIIREYNQIHNASSSEVAALFLIVQEKIPYYRAQFVKECEGNAMDPMPANLQMVAMSEQRAVTDTIAEHASGVASRDRRASIISGSACVSSSTSEDIVVPATLPTTKTPRRGRKRGRKSNTRSRSLPAIPETIPVDEPTGAESSSSSDSAQSVVSQVSTKSRKSRKSKSRKSRHSHVDDVDDYMRVNAV